MNKCFLIIGFIAVAGCANDAVRREQVRWTNAGTVVHVGPATESTRRVGLFESAVLGKTKLSRTRVETTRGVFLVGEKIGVVEMGAPVRVGYDSAGGYSGRPSYLTLGGRRYKIVR